MILPILRMSKPRLGEVKDHAKGLTATAPSSRHGSLNPLSNTSCSLGCSLGQWFSAGGDYVSREHFAQYPEIFLVVITGVVRY